MEAFITPVLLTVVVAFIAAVLLTIAGKIFFVPTDETAVKIRECLPGANCGGCGFAGCDDYAAKLAEDHDTPCNKCAPGGAAVAEKIASILGKDAGSLEAQHATVFCSGLDDVAKKEMDYQGIKTCAAAKNFFQTPNACKYGCIGLGDCVKVCPVNAIEVCNGLSKINFNTCVGCGACAKACPQNIIDLIPVKSRVYVACSSCDKGRDVNSKCTVGCIGCGLCQKTCKFDAIHVENNLAVIDPAKCKNCGMCAKACPRHVIVVVPRV